jgi:hypothetical protein
MRLSKCEWFTGMYQKVYNVLAMDGLLPSPDEIDVLSLETEQMKPEEKQAVDGMFDRKERKIYFKRLPPSIFVFAHLLEHLNDGLDYLLYMCVERECRDMEYEAKMLEKENITEYVVNALAYLAFSLAQRGIEPPANIARVFTASYDDVLEALKQVYQRDYKSITDFLLEYGLISPYLAFSNDGRAVIVEGEKSRLNLLSTIANIVTGSIFDKNLLEVVFRILEKPNLPSLKLMLI